MVSTLALLSLVGSAAAQAVTGIIVPSSTPPAGCANSRDGSFSITIVNASTPAAPVASNQELLAVFDTRSARIASRQSSGTLTMTLDGGVLTDQDGRTGYIASNYQFQFDKPPQAGAIYTGGFSMCPNGSLALGGNAVFWSCLSGTFYNLYDRDWAPHCEPVYFYSSTGAGTVFTTSPPSPQSTGPNQNTIANGGGTQSRNMTTTGFGSKPSTTGAGSSGAATTGASGTGAASSGAQTTGAGAASGSASGSGSGAPSSSSSGNGAAGAIATQAPQALFALAAAGFMGAIALV